MINAAQTHIQFRESFGGSSSLVSGTSLEGSVSAIGDSSDEERTQDYGKITLRRKAPQQ
ncbi:MAG TPA: hypothetical protein VF593_07515 [Chthoniobacteraceae bacterium]|jgi:hypothetical protein